MPQLDIFAFTSELFWLLAFAGAAFYSFFTKLLPNLYYVLKARQNRIQTLNFNSTVFGPVSLTQRIRNLGFDTTANYTRISMALMYSVNARILDKATNQFYLYSMLELNAAFYSTVHLMLNLKSVLVANKVRKFLESLLNLDESLFDYSESNDKNASYLAMAGIDPTQGPKQTPKDTSMVGPYSDTLGPNFVPIIT